MSIIEFINTNCHQSAAYRVQLSDLIRAYRPNTGSRTKLVADLTRAGYCIGVDARGVTWLAGVALEAPAAWSVDAAGRMRKTVAA